MDLSQFQLLKQGAEAKLYLGDFLGQKSLVKERFSKSYRHPDLDSRLTKERMRAEARAIIKCKTLGISTPKLFFVDQGFLVMEYLDCPTAKDFIVANLTNREILLDLASKMGQIVAKLHNNSVIHGDLTTSNLLVKNGEIYVIDFGLSSTEATTEDKGVDLYVLERALLSAHPGTEYLFEAILKSYEDNLEPKMRSSIMKKFSEIRMRGRKRDMVG